MGSHSPTYLEDLARDGFVIVPSALTGEQLEKLRAASQHAASIARAGEWPFVRTLPKQFPPWSTEDRSQGIWGVQHLLHPDMPSTELFAESYFGDLVMGPAKHLLQCTDADLIMELYNLLIRPDADFALRWHRDDVPATASAEEELQRLAKPAWHAQWNLALYDDASLIVVPGTHARARTDEEREADPFAEHLEGMKVVTLKAGDAVFYNNNILHRGVYRKDVERMTLHGSVGHVNGGRLRARNVLQHGAHDWVEKCDFGPLPGKLSTRAAGMKARLLEMGSVNDAVGFSHPD
jgi:Phytanoyl-CoA dioxygenase (PhyH)